MADVPVYANDDSNLADAGKMFSTNFEVTGIGATQIPLVLFRNPSGSGKLVKLYRLTLSNLHTVNSFIRVRAYVAPTVTSDGTSNGVGCTLIGGAAPAAVAFTSPTVSANGTRVTQYVVPAFAAPTQIEINFIYILPANTQMLITGEADGTNRILGGSLIWAEV